jgi:hypothetical protein
MSKLTLQRPQVDDKCLQKKQEESLGGFDKGKVEEHPARDKVQNWFLAINCVDDQQEVFTIEYNFNRISFATRRSSHGRKFFRFDDDVNKRCSLTSHCWLQWGGVAALRLLSHRQESRTHMTARR